MELTGKITVIKDTQQVSDKFKKREFVVEYAEHPQYPEFIKFEVTQDKCDGLNDFSVGDNVSVSFNLKGRKWTNKEGVDTYFNTLQAWRVVQANEATTESPVYTTGTTPQSVNPPY